MLHPNPHAERKVDIPQISSPVELEWVPSSFLSLFSTHLHTQDCYLFSGNSKNRCFKIDFYIYFYEWKAGLNYKYGELANLHDWILLFL